MLRGQLFSTGRITSSLPVGSRPQWAQLGGNTLFTPWAQMLTDDGRSCTGLCDVALLLLEHPAVHPPPHGRRHVYRPTRNALSGPGKQQAAARRVEHFWARDCQDVVQVPAHALPDGLCAVADQG